jgi:mono/diheme cytochrome c family protein
MGRQWGIMLAAVGLLLIIAACGRVNLEDLTPEAVKTEQAQAALTQVAQATEQSGSGLEGDPARGQTNFNVWCNGCHAAGGTPRGPNILGNVYPVDEYLPMFRTGVAPSGGAHPVFETFRLSDDSIVDILTYVSVN